MSDNKERTSTVVDRVVVYALIAPRKVFNFCVDRGIQTAKALRRVIHRTDEDAVLRNKDEHFLENMEKQSERAKIELSDTLVPHGSSHSIVVPGGRLTELRRLFDCTLNDIDIEIQILKCSV